MFFNSFFKTLIGKEMAVELKNDVSLTGWCILQAGRQAGKQAYRQAGRQAGKDKREDGGRQLREEILKMEALRHRSN